MEFFGLSHQGMVRDNNEDSFVVFDGGINCLPNLAIVADGMGGHQSGEIASRLAIDYFIEYVKNNEMEADGIMDFLNEAVQYANVNVYEKSLTNVEYYGMGTTFTACVVDNGRIHIAHVGDSRVYIIKKGTITLMTTDHTYVNEMVRAGHLTAEEAAVHPRRNALTKALGVERKVEVDGYTFEFDKTSKILICSDGLTNMVDEKDVLGIMESSDSLETCAGKLIASANENGGADNITVILGKGRKVK